MTLQTFEGTWEEIQSHAPELTGRRLRVTVLEDEQEQPTMFLAAKLKGKTGTVKGASPNLSQQTGEQFSALMTEKYQP